MSHASMRIRDRFGRRAVISTALAAAAVGGTVALSQPADAATTWAGLRQCESGGDYSINTGNGFYGAYQFNLQTWHGLGYSGLPSDASPATQDAAAQKLFAERGSSPWPVCGQGLQGGTASSAAVAAPAPAAQPAAARADRSAVRTSLTNTTEASYVTASLNTSPLFTTALVGQDRGDVRAWQTRMNKLGYHLVVDGRYGPQSAGAARELQRAKGLAVDGIVGPQTWRATFG
ncbi:MAG: transglycosylase family protein [Frankia sp.]